MARISAAAAILVAAALGCESTSAKDQDRVAVTDSAGVEIVQSHAPRWDTAGAWIVESTPIVQVGMAEGPSEYMFTSIEGALLQDDGGFVVADRGSSEIRFFAADGSFLKKVGRAGEGPGEYSYIRGLERCGGDSLFVYQLNHDYTVLTADGEYARQGVPFYSGSRSRSPYLLRCADNGVFAAIGWEARIRNDGANEGPTIGFYRADAPAWILAPLHSADTAGREQFPAAGLVLTGELGTVLSAERIGTDRGSRPHPFGRATRIAIDRDGIYLGTGEDFEFRMYSQQGTLRRIVRWPHSDVAITPDDLTAYRDEQLESTRAADRPAMQRSLAEMPMPPQFPTYVSIEADDEGNVWLERLMRPGSQQPAEWEVFTPDGEWLGTVRIPSGLEILDIGSDLLIGVSRDELGVERVQAHRLVKR